MSLLYRLLFVFLSCMLLVGECDGVSTLTAPVKPTEWKDTEQMRDYVKALNDYYMLVGRPR